MKKFLVAFLALIGGLALLAVLAFGVLALVFAIAGGRPKSVAQGTVLEIDFGRPIREVVPDDPITQFTQPDAMSVHDLVVALRRAKEDPRVVGVFADLSAMSLGLAQVQEIRDAVVDFRASGKPAAAWADTFGEAGPGNGAYYMATAFDDVSIQPSGDVGLTGLMYETPFVRGMLDKIGVEPRIGQRYEYKNAANMYNEKQFTAPHREALAAVMNSQFGQIVAGIAEARGKSVEEVRQSFERGPYLGRQALDAGLVDGLAYREEALTAFRTKLGDDSAELLYASKYLDRAGHLPYATGDETLGLVYGVGAVVRGESSNDPLTGGSSMGSQTVAAALRAAVDDDEVKAIVFRVDSPGGSYVASDSIWHETVRAREKGKPVIVSMGNIAGSGGYFVAMAADKIVAQPGTITGSIGVLGGKMFTKGMWDKVGITWDEVHTSDPAVMFTGTQDYNENGKVRLDAWLDRVYEDFTGKVAQGRKLDPARVHEIARGRIWSGEDAKRLGLVDELGGLETAIRLARESAGIGADAPVRLKAFPRPASPVESLLGRDADSSEDLARAWAAVLARIRPAVRLADRLGWTDMPRGALAVPEFEPAP